MSALHVLEPGLLSTVQDRGRFGHLRAAVPPSGPADPLEFEIAQRLVGNAPADAAIEVVGLPFRFSLDAPRIVAVGGRDVRLRGRDAMPDRTAVFVRAGEEVAVVGSERTRYAYLAVTGGIATAPALGSRATYVPASIGRAPLAAGDELPLGAARVGPEQAALTARSVRRPERVRFMAGPHRDLFSPDAWRTLVSGRFRVSARSDRMGMRLEGAALGPPTREIISIGVLAGAIQVPHGGEPIVLLADHQTTGGYAVIGCVIQADIGVVAQSASGEELSFYEVDRDAAVAALREERRWLDAIDR